MNLTLGGNSSTAPTKDYDITDDTTATSPAPVTEAEAAAAAEVNITSDNIESVISSIISSSYSEVGDGFLDCLVKEIAAKVRVQTVMIHRLLTLKEYVDLRDNEGCPCIQLVVNGPRPTSEKSKSCETSPTLHNDALLLEEEKTASKNKLEYMLVKACYSSLLNHNALKKYAAVPISSLSADSPQLQTLKYSNHHVTQDASLSTSNSVYPEYSSFVGVRLDQGNLPIGLITIMNDKPLAEQQLDAIEKILQAVQLRTKNEIEKIRQRDNLIMMKNAALQDAEGKIKFLADMSHEIRTPMNAVIALTDLLLQERYSLNDEQAEHLEVIQTSGNHLLTVVNDILDISKINHDPKFKLENRRFSLRKCVKDALNMARHQASMTQYNKLVCVLESPADVNDNIPLNQLINQLEKVDPSAYNNIILSQRHTDKTVLPLLWKIDSDVPDHLICDTMRLTQILLNLCSNAVKFTKSGGIRVKITRYVPPGTPQKLTNGDGEEITKYQSFKDRYDAKIEGIYTRVMKKKSNSGAGATTTQMNEDETTITEEEGYTTTEEDEGTEKVILEISVTDTGIGIPADRLPRLFKSFSQIDISTARRYGGTGLGLAISSMLVNRMGGGLWVESEEGIGSRFALTLPLSIAFGRATSVGDCGSGRGSESSCTYSSSGMIASPRSPGSSVSDESSTGGNTNDNSNFISAPSSPSNSIGYFPLQLPNNNNTSSNTASNASNNNNNSSSSGNNINRSYKFPTSPISPIPLSNNSSSITTNTNNSMNISATAKLPWDPSNIPSNPSPTNATLGAAPSLLFEPSSSSTNNNYSNNTTATNINNNAANNNNSNKELHNIINTKCPHRTDSGGGDNNNSNNNDRLAVDTAATTTATPATTTTKPKSSRVTLSKQYHSRKSNTNSGGSSHHEENLALLYPIKIMLAEDNVLNQKIAISILKRLGYQDVIIAGDGREALDLMRIHKFDVIFMDLYMPEMDGLEATRFIISERKHNVPPPPPTAAIEEEQNQSKKSLLNVNDVYIIALTASASKQDRQICIDAGMNDFISKPFTMMEMKSALQNCASKRKKRKKQQLHDELVQKQLQQQQELVSNALLVKYTSNDHPMTTEEEEEQAEDEESRKCRSNKRK